MYEKYHTALRLMNDCIATKTLERPAEGWPMKQLVSIDGDPYEKEYHPAHSAWDICFDFIFANFAEPDTAMGTTKKWGRDHPEVKATTDILMAGGEEMVWMLHSMPPELAEQVFPVGVARFLLRDAALPIQHRLLRTFKQFHEWYGSMILA